MTKTEPSPKIRVDKWLWHARFFKTRGRASEVVSGGHLRVNRARVFKPAHAVGIGDVLTFAQQNVIRVVEIAALAERRGPATEAQALYKDLTPQVPRDDSAPKARKGRVDKRERRAVRDSKEGALE